MSKEQLTTLIKQLTLLKIEYYRKLELQELNIECIIEDVFEDIYKYLPEEYGYILDTISVQDALVLMIGGTC